MCVGPLKVVFAGTPDFACPSLEAIRAAGHMVPMVVTQPDRPRGRGQRVSGSPVKLCAASRGLDIAQPEAIDTPAFRARVEALAPDAAVVVAFGQKIPSWLLSLPRFGCLNVHASLLPRYRGAAPIQRAIMNGDAETGVTIMLLDEGWDTGPLLCQRVVPIAPDENAGVLHDRLAEAGAVLLVEALSGLATGRLIPRPQDDARATRAPRLRPEETRLDWQASASRLHNLIRALAPAPLAETFHGRGRLQIVKARAISAPAAAEPGTVVAVDEEGFAVQTGDGVLMVMEVKPAGGRVMPAAAYVHGHRLLAGTRLG